MKGASRLLFALTIFGVMFPGYAQNLVQNPSFEAVTDWDSLWILSTVAPSSPSAVATVITTDAHDGLRSVELSNTVFLKWTYLYTDTASAPLIFESGERYEVRGWLKSIEEGKATKLSVFWNNGLNELIFYNDNPDPVTNPDWFLVKDTLYPTDDYSDGYLSLGFRADKVGSLPVGKLLLDDFAVTRLLSINAEIVDFSLPEQTGPAVIDAPLATVTVEVPLGTDVTALVPAIQVSPYATISPPGGVPGDFTAPLVYTVTAEDGITTRDWTVTVTFAPPSTETDILTFAMAEETGPATIDNVLHNVMIEVEYGTDVSTLAPTIDVSFGATVNPASDVTRDFSAPLIYTVTAQDGITNQNYIVATTVCPISNETDILAFTLAEQAGPAVIDDVLHTVAIEVDYGTDVTALVPTIGVSAGATIDPASGVARDFSSPVIYTVTAEDGVHVQDWTVTVTVLPNTATDITSFTLAEQAGPATIDDVLHTLTIEVPYNTDVTALIPTLGISAGATVNPASDVATDFSSPVIYTVTAEDGVTMQDWTATVVVLPNTETEITSFTLVEQAAPAVIDNLLFTITIEVPYGTGVTALVPAIGVSPGATVNPVSDVAADFSSPVIYTVTAEDGITTQDWTATVVVQSNTATDITSFVLAEQTGPAVIDELLHTVTIEVPNGTDVTALVPTLAVSPGATVNPASDVAADFTAPVVYTVTAGDGVTVQDWTVTVVVLPSSETEIASFILAEQAGPAVIDNLLHTVTIEVPYGTGVTALVPTIGISAGATVNPASDVAADFSSPVVYTVTAEDGVTTQDWTVTVVILPNTETDITSFTLAEQTGPATIDNVLHTVDIEVVKETDVTALVPTIGLSAGATIDPADGSATDFSSPVIYTVTAEDGITTQDWTITVTVDPAVSTDPVPAPVAVHIYPNPARQYIHVELSARGDLYLQDIMGRVVATIQDASDKITIPVSEMERGIYFVQFVKGESTQVYRIILE